MVKKLIIFALVLAMVLAFTSCSQTQELTIVRVNEVTHSIFYAPQYVAVSEGFFAEQGLEIEITNGGGADKVMTAVLTDAADIGLAGPEASIYVYNEGKDDYPKVFAGLTAKDGSFLMARTPMEDFDFASLEGAHILPGRVGGIPYMALRSVIAQSGLHPDEDMNLDTSIQFENMTAAFLSGTGDYVTMFEPTASATQSEGKAYIVASVGAAAGEMPYTAYFATQEYLSENSEIVQKFTDAIHQAQIWVQEHTASEVAQSVQSFFPDTDLAILESAVQSYKDAGAYAISPVIEEEAFDNLQNVIMEAGELSEKAPFDAIIDNSFAKNY